MKRVSFKAINIRDFKSFLGAHHLHLDLEPGLWFMRGRNKRSRRLGSNGSGKSSIWDALVWCLFGVTPGGLRNTDVTPWSGVKRGTRVCVVVEINDRHHYITRRIKPNSLTIDAKDVGPDAVVKLLGMNLDLMTNTIILGQGRPLFFDMTAGNKMQLLSDAQQLERWDTRSKRASDQAKELDSELATCEGEITGFSSAINEFESGLGGLRELKEKWDVDYEKRMGEGEKFLRVHGKRIERLRNEVALYDLKYDSAMTELKACERDVEKMHGELRIVTRKMDQRLSQKKQLNANLEVLNKQYQKLGTAENCPTCGQPVIEKDLAKHKKEIFVQIRKAREDLKVIKVRALRKAIEMLESNIKHQRSYLEGFHSKADAALRDHKVRQGELAQITEQHRAIVGSFDKGEVNPHLQSIRMTKKRIERLQRDLDNATHDKRQIEKELIRARTWSKGFREIKLHIIEELLQELELVTCGMLEEVGLVGWTIKYQIERETKRGTTKRGLNIMIQSPESKGLVKWESWSGGEGQRLRVVGALALASVLLSHAGVRPSIEVLDEPTQHLSDEGIKDLCEYLADRARTLKRRVFYCDHQSVDSARFAGTITVRKDRRGSHIVGAQE